MIVTIKNISGAAAVPPRPFMQVSLADAGSKAQGVGILDLLAYATELREAVASKKWEVTFDVDQDSKDVFELALRSVVQGESEIAVRVHLKDANAAATATVPIFVCGDRPAKVKEARIVALAASAQDANNYATVAIKKYGTDGASAATVATRNTKTGEGGTLAQGHVELSPAATSLVEGQSIVVEETKAGTGVAVDAVVEIKLALASTLKASAAI